MNKRTIASVLAAFMLLLIAAQTVTAQQGSAREYLQAGNNSLNKGDYDHAISMYEAILQYYPNSSQARDAKKKLEDRRLVAYREEEKRKKEYEEQKRAQEQREREAAALAREAAARTQEAEQRRGTIRLYSPVDGAVLLNGEASGVTAVANTTVDINVEDAPGKTFTLTVQDSKGTVFEAFSRVTFEEQERARTDQTVGTGTVRRENPPQNVVFDLTPRTPEGVVVERNTPLNKFAIIRDPNPPVNSGDDFAIRQNNQGGITITKYTGSRRQVVIPETIEGIRVTEIGEGAFSNASDVPLIVTYDNYSETVGRISPIGRQVYSVFIPNTVTAIRGRAFKGQLLREVRIGNSVKTIGSEAFYGCELTSLTIPNSVTEIGGGAFQENAINSLTLGTGLVEIRADTFRGNALTELSLPASLRTIGYRAFMYNRITSLTIPRGVTTVRSGAFALNQQLTTVSLPSSLTDFEDAFVLSNSTSLSTIERAIVRFNGSSNIITTITIGANVSERNLRQFGNNFSTFYESQGKKAGTYAWSGRLWSVK